MTEDMEKLEEEFKHLMTSVGDQIEKKLAVAEQALADAIELSNKFGIPFYANISQLSQAYVPPSYEEKFQELDSDFVMDLTDVSSYDLGSANGWRHSAIC